jgi:hypothetical protein
MSSLDSDADSELPPVDARLVAPGSGYEIDDGKLVYVPPCDEPHGSLAMQLGALLIAHVTDEFRVAGDLLTRTSRIDDIAPDASIYPRAPHPITEGRQLEHLAFEIASTQTLVDAGRKASKLIGRGVRRVFAIDAQRERALEWSTDLGSWVLLDPAGLIEDPVFAVPLPIAALVRVAITDDVLALALIEKRNRVLENRYAEGRAEAVVTVLAARGIAITEVERAAILAERDPDRIARWLADVATCRSAGELLSRGAAG